jgi:hypothetical protein
MKLKFAEILKENLTPRQERYIDVIVNAMKDHFTDESGSVVNNNTIFMENPNIADYKLKVDLYNEANKKLIELYNSHSNLSSVTPKDIRDYRKEFISLNAQMDESMQYIMNLSNLFGDVVTTYNVPVNVILIAWEKFHKEVYKPQEIEVLKSKSTFEGLQHGLPEGNYSKEKYMDSFYGKNRYAVIENKDNGDYILAINKKWDWFQKGMELDDLFYKRYNSLDELKDDLYNVERRLFIKELDGYDVPDPEDVLEHLEASNIDDMEKYWEEEREDYTNLTFEEFIGDEVNRYLMDEKGMGYESISRANRMQIGRDFIELEELYNGIGNI